MRSRLTEAGAQEEGVCLSYLTFFVPVRLFVCVWDRW